MPGNFSVRRVLKTLSRPLIASYVEEYRPIPEVLAAVFSIKDISLLWDLVPNEHRSAMEADLRKVFDLADEKGIASLFDEAEFHGLDPHELFDAHEGMENKALAALLADEVVFEKAAVIRQADGLRGNSWRRWAGLPRGERAITEAMGDLLAERVGEWFFRKEGRGLPCVAERLLRQQRLHYVFLYLADHTQRVHVWEGGKLGTKDQRPAFDVVFTFNVLDGILAVWTTGNGEMKGELKRLFCEVVFGRDIEATDPLATAFRLDTFKAGTGHLQINGEDGIEAVLLRRLTLAPLGRYERIDFEAAPRERLGNFPAILEENLRKPLLNYDVLEASIQFALAPRGASRRPRSFTFDIHAGGFSNLHSKPDEYRALGEKYLRLWGVDVPDASA